jgi:hypothetical protein
MPVERSKNRVPIKVKHGYAFIALRFPIATPNRAPAVPACTFVSSIVLLRFRPLLWVHSASH